MKSTEPSENNVGSEQSASQPILLSACLNGIPCRYDGRNGEEHAVTRDGSEVVLACPEILGGLATPRARAEIVGGDGFDVLEGKAVVVTATGEDVTQQYIRGALEVLELAQERGISVAVLQEYSPSCGCSIISDGTFLRRRRRGLGVTAALLHKNGISIRSSEDGG